MINLALLILGGILVIAIGFLGIVYFQFLKRQEAKDRELVAQFLIDWKEQNRRWGAGI